MSLQSPLRLLVYTHALAGGGAERVLALLASELARRGHDVSFAVDREGEENRRFLAPEVRLLRLHGNNVAVALRLAKLLRQERFDVTLSGIGGPNFKHVLAAILAGRRRRAVQSAHGFAIDEPGFLNALGNRLIGLTTRLAGPTIAVSEALRLSLVNDFKAPAAKVFRVYNPVVLTEAPALRLPNAAPLILFVGRLVPGKDPMAALAAFAQLRDRTARLRFLGDGPLRPTLEAEAARLDLTARVDFAGYVPEPWPHFAKAHALLLTSHRETFGNVVVEALSFGLPVVATACGGPEEILNHPALGALVPVGDIAAMTAALDAALAAPGDPDIRRARAREFSPAAAAAAVDAIFRDIVRAG